MECFANLMLFLRWMGLLQNNYSVTIVINCFIFGILVEFFITSFWYLLLESKSFETSSECAIYVLFTVLVIGWYSNSIWQREKYTCLFTELNALILKSKCYLLVEFQIATSIYRTLNQRDSLIVYFY